MQGLDFGQMADARKLLIFSYRIDLPAHFAHVFQECTVPLLRTEIMHFKRIFFQIIQFFQIPLIIHILYPAFDRHLSHMRKRMAIGLCIDSSSPATSTFLEKRQQIEPIHRAAEGRSRSCQHRRSQIHIGNQPAAHLPFGKHARVPDGKRYPHNFLRHIGRLIRMTSMTYAFPPVWLPYL